MRLSLALAAITLCAASPAAAKPARFAGPATRVMVLATPHLSGLPDKTLPAVTPLLDRLAAWRPTIVAIEALPGPSCEFYLRYKARYGTVSDDYCWDPAPARAATGLDVPAATTEAERLLTHWPAEPTPGQRRHLAAVFLAANESASALVQWLRMPPDERREGDGLDTALVARLARLSASRNENYAIGAALAARLGHERVTAVDDHTADTVLPDEEAFGKAIQAAWDSPLSHARRAEHEKAMAGMGDPRGLIAAYRFFNSPTEARAAFAGDFGAALAEPSPQHFGRSYVAAWEARNLRMVANIRQASRDLPGARVLAIVGSSHKSYYERYLGLLHDVRVVDAASVLR